MKGIIKSKNKLLSQLEREFRSIRSEIDTELLFIEDNGEIKDEINKCLDHSYDTLKHEIEYQLSTLHFDNEDIQHEQEETRKAIAKHILTLETLEEVKDYARTLLGDKK